MAIITANTVAMACCKGLLISLRIRISGCFFRKESVARLSLFASTSIIPADEFCISKESISFFSTPPERIGTGKKVNETWV